MAANQNHTGAQFFLGVIYLSGEYITRDINKAIHYFSLVANKNNAYAQFFLGIIYSNGEYNTVDINKSIHYYSLAANQNHIDAQFELGYIYSSGEYITQDINKAIHYLTLAANQNHAYAQFNLGFIYMNGEYVTVDIKKAKHYFSLAANQKNRDAQLILDKLKLIDKNSSLNIDSEIIFESAFLLHEGKYTKKNIQESISLYKKLSSLNNQYAKNNLGIIYKNGYGEEISKNVNNAIVYFEEAISQKNDYLSMYNLAHIYLFSETVKHDINKSIDLLIKSS